MNGQKEMESGCECKWKSMKWNEVNGLLWSMVDGCDGWMDVMETIISESFKCLDLILHQRISSLLLIILL